MLLRYIGRLAFPIFAFLIAQGYIHTINLPRYLGRLLGLAIITDFPYQFMRKGDWTWDPFENVIWTFIIALIVIHLLDISKKKLSLSQTWLLGVPLFIASYWLAGELSTDYYGLGVTTVVGFYLFRGNSRAAKLKQVGLLVLVNIILANIHRLHFITLDTFPLYWEKYGWELISPQYYALLSLPIIWLYSGKAGYQSKSLKTFNYLFYPLHMVVIGVVKLLYF
jgi:hypothetical protein